MPDLEITQQNDAVVLTVKVVPGSSKTAIAGKLDNVLKVKVAAPPEKGKANTALTAFFADRLGTKKKAVTVISGTTSTIKQLRIDGAKVSEVRDRIREILETAD